MSTSSAFVATQNRLTPGPTSITVAGPGRSRLEAVGTLVDMRGLNLGYSDIVSNWVGAPCDSKVPIGFKNVSSDGGASDGSLIGKTI
jgi:hypothetical protein